MTGAAHHLRNGLADDSGVTLIELVVGIALSLIVMAALMAMIVTSQHQTSILRDVSQATQYGRTTMTRIVDELHSGCISEGFAPVQKGSSATKLVLVDAYSEKAEIEAGSTTREDELAYENSKLVDTMRASTGGSAPEFTFAESPTSKVTIGTHISKSTALEREAKKTATIFRYYKYRSSLKESEVNEPSDLLEELSVPAEGLSAGEAKEVAAVGINFIAAPADGMETVGRTATFSTIVTLAFSVPSAENKVVDGPCK